MPHAENREAQLLFNRLPIEWQCNDTVLSLAIAHRKKRCADFIDLKKATSLTDAAAKQDPMRISGTPFLYEEPGGYPVRTSDVHHSPLRWVNCVGILSYPTGATSGGECCAMGGVLMHLNAVGQYARWDSKASRSLHSRLIEDEPPH